MQDNLRRIHDKLWIHGLQDWRAGAARAGPCRLRLDAERDRAARPRAGHRLPPIAADPTAKPEAKSKELVGIASRYGAWHQGKRTASGTRFNRNAFTAAHKSLSLGTRVEVTNLANQRSVVLTINDRGPYIRGRVIDVTERAAKTLGFHQAGLARVRIRVLPA